MITYLDWDGGNGATYPYSFTLTNPGAETGDATGWTTLTGTGVFASTSNQATYGFSGTYHFRLDANAAFAESRHPYQDIPSSHFTDVDAGSVAVTLSYRYAGPGPGSEDPGRFRLEFYSGTGGSGVFLGQTTSDSLIGAGSGFNNTLTSLLPPGTRSVALFAWGTRTSGTELSFYFELTTLTLSSSASRRENLYAMRGSDASGWTVVSGSGQPPSDNTWSDWGWGGIYGNSQAAYEIYKEITPSAAALAQIAAGAVSAGLRRYAWNENDDDQSRTYIKCLNSSNTVLATAQDAASPTDWNTTVNVKLATDSGMTVSVPTTTTKFRVGHQFARVDGTVLDAAVGFVDAYLTW